MGQLCEIELEGAAISVRRARAFASATLASWSIEQVHEAVVLLASELVTNAVTHARTRLRLSLELEGAELLVEVHDQSAEMPSTARTNIDDERGRGLALVNRLADRWGTRAEAGGKVVWFAIGVPPGGKR